MRILVADDDPTTLKLLEVVLGMWQYDIISVKTGDEALEVLRSDDPPHIAIIDWMMPGMKGVEVCRQIRKESQKIPAYIILLTSLTDKKNIIEGLIAGADDFISKPFNRQELQARIKCGERSVKIHTTFVDRIEELEEDVAKYKKTHEMDAVCKDCDKIQSNDSKSDTLQN